MKKNSFFLALLPLFVTLVVTDSESQSCECKNKVTLAEQTMQPYILEYVIKQIASDQKNKYHLHCINNFTKIGNNFHFSLTLKKHGEQFDECYVY